LQRSRYFACMLVMTLCALAHGQRLRYNFNPDWLLQTGDDNAASDPSHTDSSWQHVTLPHAWNEDSAYRVAIHDQPTGVAWYRKHFSIPHVSSGGHVYIEFEGARLAAEVFLNGHRLGLSENGVMAFGFDLTPYLIDGDNVLSVRTDNRWDYREKATNSPVQWNNNNFYSNFGGLNKNVWLHVTPAIHQTLPLYSSLGTTGQYIWADAFDIAARSAMVHAESQVLNTTKTATTVKLRADVADLNGHIVMSATSRAETIQPGAKKILSASALAHDLHFWSWGYGYLYKVTTTVLLDGKPVDSVVNRTGFRETSFQDGMINLNGRVLQVHGYASRSTNEWPGLGIDVPPWVSDFSNGLMVEDNANLVRWMHVTPSKQDVQSCDRVGLLMSMPAGDAEGDPKGREWQARVDLMRDSVVYNRNNPSVIFYESGNKGISDLHMQDMVAVRNEFDPHGGRAIGAREMLGSQTAEYGGEMLYINKSAHKPLWAHEYNRDEGARKFWNEETPPFHKDSPLYNRNQDSFTLEDVLRWDDYFRARPGTGKRVSAGGVNISWFDENSHYRGDNNYRRSGEVDAMRIPKDAFFAHQVMWDGWVDPEHPRVHISGHWNYQPGSTRTIYVEANTATVELKLNGHSLGVQNPTNDFLFTFLNVPYSPGRLEATAYDEHRHPVATTALETTGAPVAIRLTPHTANGTLRDDGSDLALVDVEVVDVKGRRVPTALNMIHFAVTGPAEWRGGIAQGSATPVPQNNTEPGTSVPKSSVAAFLHDDNYILSKNLPIEGGVNRVSIRSTRSPGTIVVTAMAAGLREARISLQVVPVPVHHGLSLTDPAANLPVHLGRGPTPSTPSFTVTRTPIPFTTSTAGANEADAARSYDDDETTAWTNASTTRQDISSDGFPIRHADSDSRPISAALDTAWIEYTLAQPSSPSSIDLKLGSFRLRRYPLSITLDGKTVYEGVTPTSLGYVTLPLQRTIPGTRLRIRLVAPAFNVEEARQLVEVNGKVDQAPVAGTKGVPVLSIFEADLYNSASSK
jgi:beta-galactosidase